MFSRFIILLLIMYSSLDLLNGLRIVEHFAQPNLVANCSRTELICSLASPTADAMVSWSFHGENAASLPSAHVQRDFAESRWRLVIDCTTIRHAGTYVCNAHSSGKKEVIYRKEAVVQVYVPVQVNIDQPQIKQSSRNSATLLCNITGYPRVQVKWFKLQRNTPPPTSFKNLSPSQINQELDSNKLLKLYKDAIRINRHSSTHSDYAELNSNVLEHLEGSLTELKLANNVYRYIQINGTLDSKYAIENRMLEQFDDSQMQSMLTIKKLDVDDAGLYVCRARNQYGNQSENGFRLIVLETPKLRLVSSSSLSSRSIELKLAILHNSNAPVQQLIIGLRNNNNQTINQTNLDNTLENPSSLSSSKDYYVMDIINLQSDQTGNVIGGFIEEQTQNQTSLLSLNQFLGNQNFMLPFKNSNNLTNSNQPAHSKQTRNSKLNSHKSNNRFELVEPNVVRYVINNLQPKADYTVQVFAQNQVGFASISPVKILTQPDVPSRVKNVHILTRTNETLLYGWKRSADNGAEINRYEVQLAHANPENWLRNETKDVNLTNNSGGQLTAPRNNYMYIFVNLKPGNVYYFRVRACNSIGCSDWSAPPLLGITQDGHADPPENIKIKCFTQKQNQQNSNLGESSLDIQPLIQYSTSSNSIEYQSSNENQQNIKYQKEQIDDQFDNDDNSNEQNVQNMFINGRSSPTAELLKWSDNIELNDQTKTNLTENKKVSKRSLINLKNHKTRKHRKIKRSTELNDKSVNSNSNNQKRSELSSNETRVQNDQAHDSNDQLQNYATINWESPLDSRGTILGYNISLDGLTRYKNEENKEITERFKLIYEIRSNITNSLTVRVNPNTRYQVRICTLNKAGCGRLSSFSLSSQCDSAPIISKNIFQNTQQPILSRLLSNQQLHNYPQITSASHSSSNDEQQEHNHKSKNENSDRESNFDLSKSNQLVLNLPRLNERDGRILCYRIVIIRLPKYNQLVNQLRLESSPKYLALNQSLQINSTSLSNKSNKIDNNSQVTLNNPSNESKPVFTDLNNKIDSLNMAWIKSQQQKDLNNSGLDIDQKYENFNLLSILPTDPMQLPVYRYEQSISLNYSFNQQNQSNKKDKLFSKNSMYFAYLAKEMSSNSFQNQVLIGDKTESSCTPECLPTDLLNQYTPSASKQFLNKYDNSSLFYAMAQKTTSQNNSPVASARSIGRKCVYNGELEPNTNYTGFVEIHVAGINGSRLIQRSDYFKPVSTGYAQHRSTDTTFKTSTHFKNHLGKLNSLLNLINDNSSAPIILSITGLIMFLFLFLCFTLCCLKRKTSDQNDLSKVSSKKAAKTKSKKQQKKKKSKKDKEEKVMTDLDKASYSDECNDEQIKLNETEIMNQCNSPRSQLDKCLEIDCNVNEYDINFNDQLNEDQVNTLKRQSNVCTFSCLDNQLHLNLENNQASWQDDSLPPPPSVTNQTISYQQPAILIDTTTNQQILATNNPIHFLQLKQQPNQTNLTNLYEQTLTKNLININKHLNFNDSYSVYNPAEVVNNYCLNQQQSLDNESTNSTSLDINNSINSTSINTNDNESEILTAHRYLATEFPQNKIHEVFLEKHANDDQLFQIEFNLIPFQFLDRTANCSSSNKTKNRYQNIKCFDQTRVKLGYKTVSFAQTISQTMPRQSSTNSTSSSNSGGFSSTLSRTLRRKKKTNESNDNSSNKKEDNSTATNSPSILSNSQQTNDFIHANHVVLNEQSYIATQSPLENTTKDFWQMVLEQNVNMIIALCDLEEDGRQVCSNYWNESNVENGLKQFGSEIRVQLVSSRKYNDYVLRRFTLTKRANNAGGKGNQNRQSSENEICREVVQFQFLKYNEYALTEQPSFLLCFINKINEFVYCNNSNDQISSGPLLVHCEDGCGRTGTFIAIRALISLIQYNKYQNTLNEQQNSMLNIFDYVSQLRYQRYMLVDSLSQYIFIYKACLEYIKFGLDDLNDEGYVDNHIKLNSNTLDFYTNRLSYGLVSNPVNDIIAINYHNITQSSNGGILNSEFDV